MARFSLSRRAETQDVCVRISGPSQLCQTAHQRIPHISAGWEMVYSRTASIGPAPRTFPAWGHALRAALGSGAPLAFAACYKQSMPITISKKQKILLYLHLLYLPVLWNRPNSSLTQTCESFSKFVFGLWYSLMYLWESTDTKEFLRLQLFFLRLCILTGYSMNSFNTSQWSTNNPLFLKRGYRQKNDCIIYFF